ncbi:MAG TPA: YdcF family protein [Acetobacteraceae bacterium]
MSHRKRLLRALSLPALALLLGWLGGFAWFLHAAAVKRTPPEHADGIVALTGGADRVATALRMLAEGRSRLLLVSGVGGAAEFAELARRAGVESSLAGRVTLGRAAISTRGNAVETAEWVQANDIHSLIVVTAGYHMPRALAELSRTLPGVSLYPAAVIPPAIRGWNEFGAIRLLAGEYTKWLAVEAGLSGFASRGDDLSRPELERHG